MTKAELVEDVAEAAELTKKDAERLVEIVFESIIETLNQGEKIELRGFGSFRVRERGARRGRNPKTGDPVSIPAKRVPYFKPGKELKAVGVKLSGMKETDGRQFWPWPCTAGGAPDGGGWKTKPDGQVRSGQRQDASSGAVITASSAGLTRKLRAARDAGRSARGARPM